MTEEFIPRDTPIYCFVANNEKDLDRARQTRDVWTKRWGYTNFIIQERVSINTFVKNIVPDKFKTERVQKAAREKSFYYAANFIYLMEKLKSKSQHSIIIQSNTLLYNDLPRHYTNNDISFFKINQNGNINFRDGLMISQTWSKAIMLYFYNSLLSVNSEQMISHLKSMHFEMENAAPFEMIQLLPGCKHNLQEMKEKTQEEMHATIV